MLEALLANPGLTHREVAQRFGFTSRPWVSEIVGSEVRSSAVCSRLR
jgi:hypothetical protein